MKKHYDRRSEYKHSPELSFMRKLGIGLVLLSGPMILVGVLAANLFPEIAAGLTLVGVMLLAGIGILAHIVKG